MAEAPPTRNRVALAGAWRTWDDVLAEAPVEPLRSYDRRIAVVAANAREAWLALAAVVATGADAAILGADRLTPDLTEHLDASDIRVWADGSWQNDPATPRPAERGRITVVTSGTTGLPKLVPHTLDSLGTVRGVTGPPRTWLCPYAAGTYAWFQCAVLWLLVDGQDVVPVETEELDEWPHIAREWGVNAISATPTFWRRTLLSAGEDELRAVPLSQVSLGGEPVPQSLLDRLRALYPQARLTHIYASSEAGACIVVSDGRAGFPREWVGSTGSTGVEIRVEEGRLLVRSPWANTASESGWIDTGDAVRIAGDRVEIVGREEGSIVNVGGAKVSTAEVTGILLEHPKVAWCRVFAKRSPIVGELPVAEVALVFGEIAGEDELLAWCRERLPEVALPRRITFRDEIPSTSALKSSTS
ncbi:MAG: fatty acid--CoA ligase family protein [Actinomycetota bacterium]|nr:fatty acid--CoA ligase family protein [Actinomycetota bacterium]